MLLINSAQTLLGNKRPNPYIVAGDFNTERNDRQNGLKDILMDPNSSEVLVDTEGEYNLMLKKLKDKFKKGTHFYRGRWNSLDKILLPKRFFKGFCKVKRFALIHFMILLKLFMKILCLKKFPMKMMEKTR